MGDLSAEWRKLRPPLAEARISRFESELLTRSQDQSFRVDWLSLGRTHRNEITRLYHCSVPAITGVCPGEARPKAHDPARSSAGATQNHAQQQRLVRPCQRRSPRSYRRTS